jgi:hypothetical protein
MKWFLIFNPFACLKLLLLAICVFTIGYVLAINVLIIEIGDANGSRHTITSDPRARIFPIFTPSVREPPRMSSAQGRSFGIWSANELGRSTPASLKGWIGLKSGLGWRTRARGRGGGSAWDIWHILDRSEYLRAPRPARVEELREPDVTFRIKWRATRSDGDCDQCFA